MAIKIVNMAKTEFLYSFWPKKKKIIKKSKKEILYVYAYVLAARLLAKKKIQIQITFWKLQKAKKKHT